MHTAPHTHTHLPPRAHTAALKPPSPPLSPTGAGHGGGAAGQEAALHRRRLPGERREGGGCVHVFIIFCHVAPMSCAPPCHPALGLLKPVCPTSGYPSSSTRTLRSHMHACTGCGPTPGASPAQHRAVPGAREAIRAGHQLRRQWAQARAGRAGQQCRMLVHASTRTRAHAHPLPHAVLGLGAPQSCAYVRTLRVLGRAHVHVVWGRHSA